MKSNFLSTAFLASVGFYFVGCTNEGGSPLLGMATGGFTQTNNTGGTSTTQNGQGGNSTQTGGQQNQNQGGSSTGGSVTNTGGANTGGANTGGANTGGANTGGAATGGKAAGGSSTGGAATGGKAAGGSSTGGAATGGKAAGGSSSGGAATGGKAAGGSSSGGAATGGANTGGATTATGGASTGTCANFSFFVTSMAAMVKLSASSKGFGGDLRYGQADGLAGADKICSTIAATALPCAANKTWKAFLCTATVDGIDRVGSGPWYDRNGAKVWSTLTEMTSADRPPSSYVNRDDLPNEDGIPNHDYDLDGNVNDDDNHDFLTGCGTNGRKIAADTTAKRCNEWTSTTVSVGSTGGGIGMMMNGPMCGHSWPRQGSGTNWVSSIREGGCGAGINLAETGGATEATVGSGGGYGGIYCFATTP